MFKESYSLNSLEGSEDDSASPYSRHQTKFKLRISKSLKKYYEMERSLNANRSIDTDAYGDP
jgi:hypothetical protein